MSSRAIPVLAAATLTQFAAGVGFWSFGLLAPELAAETGLNERDFGLSISFTFLGTLISSPFAGACVRRFGGSGAVLRVCLCMAAAIAMVLTASWAGTMLAAFLFGLGYGPHGPVGMTMVTQSADPKHRGLLLALRHSAVPLAASASGRILPPFMLMAGWQTGVLSVAAVLVFAALFALIFARLFDVEVTPPRNLTPVQRFRELFRVPPNLRFLWATGFVFAFTQTAMTTFSYIYLLEYAATSVIAAGIFASNLHGTALVLRPVLGVVTDRLCSPGLVLGGIALVTVLAITALLQVGPETPGWVLIPIAVACGISGQCWNSVFVTAMSFQVASSELVEMNGRAFAFMSVGWMASPPIFWVLIEITGGYLVPFAALAALNLLVCALLWTRKQAPGGST